MFIAINSLINFFEYFITLSFHKRTLHSNFFELNHNETFLQYLRIRLVFLIISHFLYWRMERYQSNPKSIYWKSKDWKLRLVQKFCFCIKRSFQNLIRKLCFRTKIRLMRTQMNQNYRNKTKSWLCFSLCLLQTTKNLQQTISFVQFFFLRNKKETRF